MEKKNKECERPNEVIFYFLNLCVSGWSLGVTQRGKIEPTGCLLAVFFFVKCVVFLGGFSITFLPFDSVVYI